MNSSIGAPFYEIKLNSDYYMPADRISVMPGDPLNFRCPFKELDVTQLYWRYNGAELNDTEKIVETHKFDAIHDLMISDSGGYVLSFYTLCDEQYRCNTDSIFLHDDSFLKISHFYPIHAGSYECSAKLKNGTVWGRLKIDVKEAPLAELPDEELCGPEYSNYCKNGGTCFVDKKLKILLCKCPKQYIGPKCDYAENFVDKAREPLDYTGLLSIAGVGIFSILFVLLLIAFLKLSYNAKKTAYIRKARVEFAKKNQCKIDQIMVSRTVQTNHYQRAKLCQRCQSQLTNIKQKNDSKQNGYKKNVDGERFVLDIIKRQKSEEDWKKRTVSDNANEHRQKKSWTSSPEFWKSFGVSIPNVESEVDSTSLLYEIDETKCSSASPTDEKIYFRAPNGKFPDSLATPKILKRNHECSKFPIYEENIDNIAPLVPKF